MPKLIADDEQYMRDVLSALDMDYVTNLLEDLIEELPLEAQGPYKSDLDLWGSIGAKHILVNNIISILERTDIDEDKVERNVNDAADGMIEKYSRTADSRYMTTGPPEGFEWSEETSPTERLKWMRYNQFPGYFSREEKGLIQPHPEQDYADPELLQREWEEGKVLGLGPVIPDSLPKLTELAQPDQAELRKLMEQQIHDTVQPSGAPGVPRPFLMEMAYDYLYISGKTDAAEKFIQDGVASRTRFGFHTKAILRRMFSEMSLEDLYMHWNSIVNYRELPWVNEQYALDRFGGGAMGQNIGPIYNEWKAQDEQEVEAPNIEWPETLEWADRVSPSEAQQWEY